MSLNKNTGILIDRAINELRTGRPVVIEDKGKYWIFYNIEHAKNKIINQFKKIQETDNLFLITKQKANKLSPKKINSNIYFKLNSYFKHSKIKDLFLMSDLLTLCFNLTPKLLICCVGSINVLPT